MIDPEKLNSAKTVAFPDELSPADKAVAKLRASLAVIVFQRRTSMGLTQKQFAEKFGISQSTVSKIENGEDNLSLRSIIEVAYDLGLEVKLVDTAPQKQAYQAAILPFPCDLGKRKESVKTSKNQKFLCQVYTPHEQERREM